MCKKECKGDKCALGLIYPNTNANIACDEDCYFKSDELNNKEKYIKQYPKEMKKMWVLNLLLTTTDKRN